MSYVVDNLSERIIEEQSVLIGGTAGTGKSVLLSNVVYALSHKECSIYFVDPKRDELSQFSGLEQCKAYSHTSSETLILMKELNSILDRRYEYMESASLPVFPGLPVYLIIDELADLSPKLEYNRQEKENKHRIERVMARIATLGISAGLHIIACTECPTQDVITGEIKTQFSARVGLKTATSDESRNIIDLKGCEELPYGYCYYRSRKQIEPEKAKIDIIDWIPPLESPDKIATRQESVVVPKPGNTKAKESTFMDKLKKLYEENKKTPTRRLSFAEILVYWFIIWVVGVALNWW